MVQVEPGEGGAAAGGHRVGDGERALGLGAGAAEPQVRHAVELKETEGGEGRVGERRGERE